MAGPAELARCASGDSRDIRNALRFHKMFADAGGHVLPGANYDPQRVPGNSLIHEMLIFIEAGITPMQIIQGATKWAAESIDRGKDFGTIEAGKIADIVIVNADPLQNVENLKQVDTVVFNGKRVQLDTAPATTRSSSASRN